MGRSHWKEYGAKFGKQGKSSFQSKGLEGVSRVGFDRDRVSVRRLGCRGRGLVTQTTYVDLSEEGMSRHQRRLYVSVRTSVPLSETRSLRPHPLAGSAVWTDGNYSTNKRLRLSRLFRQHYYEELGWIVLSLDSTGQSSCLTKHLKEGNFFFFLNFRSCHDISRLDIPKLRVSRRSTPRPTPVRPTNPHDLWSRQNGSTRDTHVYRKLRRRGQVSGVRQELSLRTFQFKPRRRRARGGSVSLTTGGVPDCRVSCLHSPPSTESPIGAPPPPPIGSFENSVEKGHNPYSTHESRHRDSGVSFLSLRSPLDCQNLV